MAQAGTLDFLYPTHKDRAKYSDWITFSILNTLFNDIGQQPSKTCLELFPEYQNRLNYIAKTFKFKTYGCEFHDSYKDYFEQFSDNDNTILVNNFFEQPTADQFDLIFFKPLFSKFQEKELLLNHINQSLNRNGELLFIDLFTSEGLAPGTRLPSNYNFMSSFKQTQTLLRHNGFEMISTHNITDEYKENYTGDIFDNRDNQLHTPMMEIEKNIAIIHHLIAAEKITINSIYCRKI